MRRVLSCLVVGPILLLVGCANNAQVGDDGQGGQAAASGSTTTSTGAVGSTGAGPASSTGAGGGAATSGTATASTGTGGTTATASSGTGGSSCPGILMGIDGGTTAAQLVFACQDDPYAKAYTTNANGYIGYPKPISVDPNQKEQVWIEGCVYSNQPSMAGSLYLTAPQPTAGTSMTGTASYADGTDTYASVNDSDVTLEVTGIDETTINGQFWATVYPTNNGVSKMLTGYFSVCRVPDFLPP